jgi:hypothetical protein
MDSFPGIKRPVREVDRSPPSSAQVQNKWSYTFAPTICRHVVDRDNFTFYES